MIRLVLFIAIFFISTQAHAALKVDVSDDVISVTTGFNGRTLTVFGVADEKGDVVVVVEGPPRTMIIRQKTNTMGLWANTDSYRFKGVPTFYEVAADKPLDDIAPKELLQSSRIGLSNLALRAKGEDQGTPPFREALKKIQEDKNLYKVDTLELDFPAPNLFKAKFYLPAIVRPGAYHVRAYLFQNGVVTKVDQTKFTVVPEGLSASLRRFSTDYGFVYGLSGVLMAILAGWLATVLLKRE